MREFQFIELDTARVGAPSVKETYGGHTEKHQTTWSWEPVSQISTVVGPCNVEKMKGCLKFIVYSQRLINLNICVHNCPTPNILPTSIHVTRYGNTIPILIHYGNAIPVASDVTVPNIICTKFSQEHCYMYIVNLV